MERRRRATYLKRAQGQPTDRLREIDVPPRYQVIALTYEEFKVLMERRGATVVEAMEYGVILRDGLKIFSSRVE